MYTCVCVCVGGGSTNKTGRLNTERQVTQLALDGLLDDFTELFKSRILSLGDKMKEYLKYKQCGLDLISGVEQLIMDKAMISPFKGLETSYLQHSYYKKNFNYLVCMATAS